MVKHKKYPDYDTYVGNAQRATLKFHSLRVPFGENIINWLTTEAVEAQTWIGGGKMLELKIWAYEDSWYGIPSYEWTIEWSYFDRGLSLGQAPTLVTPLAVPIVMAVVIVIGIFALVLLVAVTKGFWHEVFGENGGIASKFGSLMLIGGGLYLGFIGLTRSKKK